MLAEIAGLFEAGALRHSPIAAWDMRRAPEAFRHLREGKNVGKVVLTVPRAIDPERTVLITGATGGLGALIARHLVEHHGARHLLLVSRQRPRAPRGPESCEAELEELGAEATIAACDVSDRDALEELLASIPAEHPLGAVIHCAGVLADGTIESLGAEQLERVFAPKVDAAWHLHELTAELDLSAFVLFSSAAGILGGPGQANYAAANVFLDALAAEAPGAKAWPPPRSPGASGSARAAWPRASARPTWRGCARGGIEALSDERGLALFDAALGAGRPQALAVPIDTAGLRGLAAAGALPPILSGLVRAAAAPQRRRRARSPPSSPALPEAEHEGFVLELVRARGRRGPRPRLGAGGRARQQAFQEIGFDSLGRGRAAQPAQRATGLGLGATTVFDYPTPAALADHLLAAGEASATALGRRRLNQLEQMLAALPAGDPGRAKLAAHLRSLAADLESDGRAEAGTPT